MANLLSAGTPFAGYFFDAILTSTGTPVTSTPVTVFQSDGVTAATCYTDQTKGSTTSNTVNTDAYGNLVFYTDPGIYVLAFTVGGTPSTKTVQVNPWYTDATWNTVIDSGAASPASGDCRIAVLSLTETLPTELEGTRVKIVNAGAPGTVVTVTAPSGNIYPQGTSSVLLYPGQSAEFFSNGSSYYTTAQGVPVPYGLGTALVGSANPGFPILTQKGGTNVAFTAGVGTLTFPETFPNALLYVGVTAVSSGVQPLSLFVSPTSASLSSVELIADIAGSGYGSTLAISFTLDGQ